MKRTIVLKRKPALKSEKVRFRNAILSLLSPLFQTVTNQLIIHLKQIEWGYVRDDWSDDITSDIDGLNRLWLNETPLISRTSYLIGESVKSRVDTALHNEIKQKTGLDVYLHDKNLIPIIKTKAAENAQLIKNVGDDYIKRVSAIVYEGVTTGKRANSLEKGIRSAQGITMRRAKFIASDQVNKLSGAINSERQKSLGVSGYIWRNSRDERVRGNPSGIYPKTKHNHWSREGKFYEWNNPPAGGHPSFDYGCRCRAEAVIDFDKLVG